MARISSLPAVALALLLLVAPAAAQPPEDPGSQGNSPEDPGWQGSTPPGGGNGNGGGRDPAPEPEPSGNQTASQSVESTARDSCRLFVTTFDPKKAPATWVRVDPDGCYGYMVKRLLERPGV